VRRSSCCLHSCIKRETERWNSRKRRKKENGKTKSGTLHKHLRRNSLFHLTQLIYPLFQSLRQTPDLCPRQNTWLHPCNEGFLFYLVQGTSDELEAARRKKVRRGFSMVKIGIGFILVYRECKRSQSRSDTMTILGTMKERERRKK